jgi:hypothetical protein
VTFNEVLSQTIAMLHQHGRVSYRALKRQFAIQDDYLEDLKDAILFAHPEVLDEAGRGLVWSGDTGPASTAISAPVEPPGQGPLAYTPPYLAEKILTSRSALEGERKQVTVLFADLKGSMELLADRDPEEARHLLDPVLERMMAAVHRYEGTVNQVMGDGIMALFGAPLAHEDHAVRACYAALAMQTAVKQLSLSRLNHWLPRGQAHPEVVQGTTEFHDQIADAFFPQADVVFDDATTLDTTIDVLDPQSTLVKPTVCLDVISLVASSCGYTRGEIEPRVAQ